MIQLKIKYIGIVYAIILSLPLFIPFAFGQSDFIVNLSDDFTFIDTPLITCPLGCQIGQIQPSGNLIVALTNQIVAIVTLLVPAIIVIFSITWMFARLSNNKIILTLIFGTSVLITGILGLIPIWFGIIIFIIVIILILYAKSMLNSSGANE